MVQFEYGDLSASIVLIQMVGNHDLASIQDEYTIIKNSFGGDFRLIACKVDNWNAELSPWEAPAVFGKESFGNGAASTLAEVCTYCTDKSKRYYIGGYSLAGLFALWVAYQTGIFSGIAAASPSVWFPGFVEYMKEHDIQSKTVYLSLGDREEKTRNPIMASVGQRISEAYEWLKGQDINCTLEWNQGNHFRNVEIRTAKAFSWVMKRHITIE